MPLQHRAQGIGTGQGAHGEQRVAQRGVKRQLLRPSGGFGQVGLIKHNHRTDFGGFGGQQGALQQQFAGRWHRRQHHQQLRYIGGNQFAFKRILPIQQACARQVVFNHHLLGIDGTDVHFIATGKIHPFATGGGIKGLPLRRAHNIAAAIAGDDLRGGFAHFRQPFVFSSMPAMPQSALARRDGNRKSANTRHRSPNWRHCCGRAW